MKVLLLFLGIIISFSFPLAAQESEDAFDSTAFEASFTYLTGSQKLPCNASISVPKRHKFLDQAQSIYVLRDLYGNADIDTVGLLGMIIPEKEGILNNRYFIVLSKNTEGFVSDEDVTDMDFDNLAEQYIEQQEADTNERLHFVKWTHQPYYNSELHVLHLPKLLKNIKDNNSCTINLNNWILGKDGKYIESIIVCDTVAAKSLGDVENWSKTLITYNKGFTYADFDESKDLKSTLTLGAIAFGGLVLAKKGFFAIAIALIAKFGKVIAIFFFGGIAAFFRKLFKKKDKSENTDLPANDAPSSELPEQTTSIE